MEYGQVRSIQRDPFAREDIIRQTVYAVTPFEQSTFECAWCGAKGKRVMIGRRLFRYGTQPDAINVRNNWSEDVFCGRSCWDSYRH